MSTSRLAWYDRWNEPSLEQLLEPLKDNQSQVIQELMDYIDKFDNLEKSVIWYGAAWKWTIRYTIHTDDGHEFDTLCYLVPNVEAPLVCVPLSDALIERLPMKRLLKYIREGVRQAKCAVQIHWATWQPNNRTETDAVKDLLKRKLKLTLEAGPLDSGTPKDDGGDED